LSIDMLAGIRGTNLSIQKHAAIAARGAEGLIIMLPDWLQDVET